MKCLNAFTGETVDMPSSSTVHQLRQPTKYWVITDAQLKRDLKGRTLRDVYRENRTGREACSGKYVPRNHSWHGNDGANFDGLGITKMGLRDEYLAECASRGHTPHPASIDGDHPLNCHRETCPKVERVSPAKEILSFHVNRLIAEGNAVIVQQVL